MAEITANLTEDQKIEIQQKTEALKERQDTADDLELLPKVGLEDVPADLHIVQGQLREIICNGLDTPLIFIMQAQWCYYQQVLIQIPDEIVQSPYFNLLSILMGEVGAGEHDYFRIPTNPSG